MSVIKLIKFMQIEISFSSLRGIFGFGSVCFCVQYIPVYRPPDAIHQNLHELFSLMNMFSLFFNKMHFSNKNLHVEMMTKLFLRQI
jgi:hypothetical protein